jgi:hypothetical protein
MNDMDSGLSDSEVLRVVIALRAIDHTSSWDRVLRIGQIVLEQLAGGSETEWHLRRRQKYTSLRRVAADAACPFRKSALSSAVNVYLFTKANPSALQMPGIKPTHVAHVVALESSNAIATLTDALENNWSVRELARRVRDLRRERGERRGRPKVSLEQKGTTLARHALKVLRLARFNLLASSVTEVAYEPLAHILEDLGVLIAELQQLPLSKQHSSRRSMEIVNAMFDEEARRGLSHTSPEPVTGIEFSPLHDLHRASLAG